MEQKPLSHKESISDEYSANGGNSTIATNTASTVGQNSLENTLNSLLSVSNLERFLKFSAGKQKQATNDDDDDLCGELSRLNQIERNLSRELDRYRFLNQSISQSIKRNQRYGQSMIENDSDSCRLGSLLTRNERIAKITKRIQERREFSFNVDEEGSFYDEKMSEPDFVIALAYMRMRRDKDFDRLSRVAYFNKDEDFVRYVANFLFGNHELYQPLHFPFRWERDQIGTREGFASVLLSTSVVVAASFRQQSTFQVWALLCLPHICSFSVKNITDNDQELSLALSIVCLRLSLCLLENHHDISSDS